MTKKLNQLVCPCGEMIDFPAAVLASTNDENSFWSVVHNAQCELLRKLKHARKLCRHCDTDAVLEIIRGDMKLEEPIMKLANGLQLVADGYAGPFVMLVVGKSSVCLTDSNIDELNEALKKAKIWNKFGDAPGMSI